MGATAYFSWRSASRMMPNGCLGSPVLVLLFGLDRGFLMDVGPNPAHHRASRLGPREGLPLRGDRASRPERRATVEVRERLARPRREESGAQGRRPPERHAPPSLAF